ncbi:MAG: hypothetical protein N2491_06560 [Negativicutes bacterium]|nr:hypothetical protein [Negativicutes bacterium]
MRSCPLCGQRGIGKVGVEQYFCWECCVEFAVQGDKLKIFNVELDGTLSAYTPPQQDVVNLQL